MLNFCFPPRPYHGSVSLPSSQIHAYAHDQVSHPHSSLPDRSCLDNSFNISSILKKKAPISGVFRPRNPQCASLRRPTRSFLTDLSMVSIHAFTRVAWLCFSSPLVLRSRAMLVILHCLALVATIPDAEFAMYLVWDRATTVLIVSTGNSVRMRRTAKNLAAISCRSPQLFLRQLLRLRLFLLSFSIYLESYDQSMSPSAKFCNIAIPANKFPSSKSRTDVAIRSV